MFSLPFLCLQKFAYVPTPHPTPLRSLRGEAGRRRARGEVATWPHKAQLHKKMALEDETHRLKGGHVFQRFSLLCRRVRKCNLFRWRGWYQSTISNSFGMFRHYQLSTDSLTEPQTGSAESWAVMCCSNCQDKFCESLA